MKEPVYKVIITHIGTGETLGGKPILTDKFLLVYGAPEVVAVDEATGKAEMGDGAMVAHVLTPLEYESFIKRAEVMHMTTKLTVGLSALIKTIKGAKKP